MGKTYIWEFRFQKKRWKRNITKIFSIILQAYVHLLADMHLAGFALAFTLKQDGSKRSHNPKNANSLVRYSVNVKKQTTSIKGKYMLTRFLMVIQKINENGQVDVYQISSENFQWTFENRRKKLESDKEYFPFSLSGNLNTLQRQAGAETKTCIKESEITFCDDYGVPGGTVIAILFPKNYIPDIIKFKDKPYMPVGLVGQVTSRPPGQIQVLYNHFEKKCAIIFNIHENIVFGFKCIALKVSDDKFPISESIIASDLFDISLSREFLNVEAISNDDLKLINETLNLTDISDIQQTLNELLNAVKSGQKEKTNTLLNKAGTLLLSASSVASSLTTIVDSYKAGGAVHQFVARIIEHATL